jgi:hypothetical protein
MVGGLRKTRKGLDVLIEIRSWLNGKILFSGEYDRLKDAIIAAVNSGANLSCANLSHADMSGADLPCANMSGANLSHADLSHANMSGANLSCADLPGANLSHADLSCANLSGANLSHANMSGANLDRKYCFLSISPIGSKNGCLWVIRGEDGILKYNRGCFSGTEEEFRAAVVKKHAGDEYEKKYLAAIEFIKIQVGEQNNASPSE